MCLEIPSDGSLTFSISDTFKGRKLSELIEQLFNIKISKDDFLTNVCVDCMSRINTARAIYQKFAQTNERLKELLETFKEDSQEVEMLVIDDVLLLPENVPQNQANTEVEVMPIKSEMEVSSTSLAESYQDMNNENEDQIEVEVEIINSQQQEDYCEPESTDKAPSADVDEQPTETEMKLRKVKSAHQAPNNKCYFCKTVFETELAFMEHLHLHFEEVPLVCEKCDNLVIKSVRQASKHLALHDEDERPHKCRICELRFFTRENSLTHERKIHRMKVKIQQNIDGYVERQKVKKFQCKICGLSVSDSQHLKKHELTHGPLPVHTCEICSKQFTAKKNLTRHLMIHTGELPYKCDLCDRAFRQAGDLKDHTRSHTKEKPYMCNVCGIRFRNISLVHVHRKKFHSSTT